MSAKMDEPARVNPSLLVQGVKLPSHMHRLSKIYWEIVDCLVKNNFSEEAAQNIVTNFFKDFQPIPRGSVKTASS